MMIHGVIVNSTVAYQSNDWIWPRPLAELLTASNFELSC